MFSKLIPKLKCINQICSKSLYSISASNDDNLDVAIIGGGIIGYSTAFWLKRENPKLKITIVEKDVTYEKCSTVLSVGGLRQQFSVSENIQMSIFCGEVLQNIGKYFCCGEENLDIQFIKRGYLLLSNKESSPILLTNLETQKKLGASLEFLSPTKIKENWPWMNVEDIECAAYGLNCEGWFDPWLLLNCIRSKAHDLGITLINGELTQLGGHSGKLKYAQIRHKRLGEINIKSNNFVNATGSWASNINVLAEKATGLSGSDYPLYVKQWFVICKVFQSYFCSKRYVFSFIAPTFPAEVFTPMVIDSTGFYFRKENNGGFICGLSPNENEEPDCSNLEVDYEWFDTHLWPKLYHRVPHLEALKVKSGWAGYYDYNVKDQNLIIGRHPAIENLFLCNGSSGHGLQHGLAIGRANMELILYGKYQTINLDRLNYERFSKNELIFEKNIF